MKLKNLLLLLFSVTFIQLTAQQVDRKEVLLEIGTGTWCQYCPGAAMGADELVENGHDVAVIEYHSGDSYENAASSGRISYYGIEAFPTSIFDGVDVLEGGSQTNSLYDSYLPMYQDRKAIPSSFTIGVIGSEENMTDFDIEVNLEKVAETDAGNIKLHAAVTESHIEESWYGLDEVNFVERLMAPDYNGTAVDFSENDSQTVNLSFSLEDEWVTDNCELVVFLQDDNSQEVLQAVKYPINQMPGLNSYDLLLEDVRNLPENDCMGQIAPVIDVTNFGNETVTGFNIEYSVNDETFTHEWEGSIATNEVATVELPEVSYNVQSQNTVEVTVTDPNG
ncbi:MAG: Omp28-related outer membrane protein, partial [Bacteroidales bacterium]|nr:Omp28-related outer membrane protein [Bacteroidales bacterium]